MGIYAGVNSRQQAKPASLLVLCSRLTAGNNERATQRRDNKAATIMTARRSFIAPLLLSSSSTRVPIVMLAKLPYNIQRAEY